MNTTRISRALAVTALVVGAAVACAPDREPVAPTTSLRASIAQAPVASLDPSGVTVYTHTAPASVPALRRTRPLASDLVVTSTIGPRGGRLEIPAAGFSLDVPAGAVAAPTTFRVTALAGDLVAYDFSPDGTSFPVALQATQDLRVTQVGRLPKRATLRAGYFRTPADLNSRASTAAVAQETDAKVGPAGASLTFPIPHFSGWIILWRGFEPDSIWVP